MMTVDGLEHTFLFADLSGLTALTEGHGDEEAADLVGKCCDVVRELLATHDARQTDCGEARRPPLKKGVCGDLLAS